MSSRFSRLSGVVVASVAVLGCESKPADAPPAAAAGQPAITVTPATEQATEASPALPPSPAAASPAPAAALTAGVTEVKRDGEPAVLDAVRAARNDGFDRVVFEFRDRVPGYQIEYIDKPVRDCGSGDVKPIAGDGWLEVRMYPAYAHTEEGQPTVPQRELRPELPILLEIERTCDFEAVVTWVLGVRSPNRYRVFELAEPKRLVVDIVH